MALVLANRVQETTATTGTGPVTLAGAVSGYQSFAAIGNGNTTYYTIVSGTNWEVGIGTYTAAGTVLARTTILSSSAAGAAITLAGTSTVFVAYPAEDAIADGYGTLPVANGGTGANTLTSGYLAKGNGTSAVSASVVYDDGTNVGIGTAVPTSRVTISNGNSTAPALNILGGGPNQGWLRLGNNADIKGGDDYLGMTFTVGAAEHMRLDASGNVGIGTSAPGAKLDVNGSAIRVTNSIGYNSSSAVRLDIGAANDASVNASAAYQWSMNTAGNANGQSLVFSAYRRADTTLEAMRLDGSGNLGIGTAVPTSRVTISNGNSTAPALNILGGGPNQGWLRLGNNADIKGGDDYLGMTFTVGAAERMRLDGSGNLGIGTSAPGAKLVVSSGAAGLVAGFSDGVAQGLVISTGTGYAALYNPNAGAIAFRNSGNSAEFVRIDSSGNVGIGNTPSGTYKLEVTGAAYASSMVLGAALPVASGGTGQTTYTDGQLLIGNTTGNTLAKATLTAGSGITITNGAGSVTIAATGGGTGTVTSVGGTGTVNGITLTGTVTSSGSLTLGGTLSGVSLTTQVSGTLPVANGGTGVTTSTGTGSTVLSTAPTLSGATLTQTLNAQTGTTYTLAATDTGKLVTLANASPVTLTIPPNSSVSWAVGNSVDLAQTGAGLVTIAPGAGVTLRATPGLKCRAQYSGVSAIKIATDEWLIVGDLSA